MPQMIPEQLLRAEGFPEIRFVEMIAPEVSSAVGLGKVDFDMHFAPQWVSVIDGSAPVTVLSGVHVGCVELFGKEGIRSIADLKGKTVGVEALGSSDHLFVSVMAAHIGLDPANDIHWVTSRSPTPADLFADGKIDACLGLPPVPQELHARNIGHVVVNSAMDRPWSEYFCCMLAGNREYVRKYPIATKRVVRAIPPASRCSLRKLSSKAVLRATATMRCKRCVRFPMTNGGSTIQKTRCGSTLCGFLISASSNRCRRRSSPTTPIGAP